MPVQTAKSVQSKILSILLILSKHISAPILQGFYRKPKAETSSRLRFPGADESRSPAR